MRDVALLSLLEQTIREQRLFQPDDKVIVAISGGADSTALLDMLAGLPGYNLRLVAAHLNHCLRGDDSDEDNEFCRRLAERYQIPFESRRIDVGYLAKTGQLNLEDAGREARIAFLDELREIHGAAAVALAHHADDQAETLLMRLLRGSGMTGLSGMAFRNGRSYVRPLLKISRSEIEQYLERQGLEWREDASNRDTTYLRNSIRHELLPLLEGYNPAIRSSLATTALVLGDDEALLFELTEQAFRQSCSVGEGRVVCSVAQLLTLHVALRRRVLRHAFGQLTGTLKGISQRHAEAICAMIDSGRPNSRLALPQRISIIREYDRLLFTQTAETANDEDSDIPVATPGYYPLPSGGSLAIEISAPPSDFNALPANIACFDLGKTPLPWHIRHYRPGDRMVPLGLGGSKKVKDLFVDRKIPLSERKQVPLLFCGDNLIWIAGVCVSELCRINKLTGIIAKVTYRSH